jgi:hypothetical protein
MVPLTFHRKGFLRGNFIGSVKRGELKRLHYEDILENNFKRSYTEYIRKPLPDNSDRGYKKGIIMRILLNWLKGGILYY